MVATAEAKPDHAATREEAPPVQGGIPDLDIGQGAISVTPTVPKSDP